MPFIPHVIPVQIMYKRSYDKKWMLGMATMKIESAKKEGMK